MGWEKALYILIGGTGILPLHNFLTCSNAVLEKKGFFNLAPAMHRGIGIVWENPCVQDDRSVFLVRVREGIDRMPAYGCHTGILIAGSFIQGGDAAAFREAIPDDIKVKVVYYAGRQDLLAEALYNQSVVSPSIRYDGRLDDALVDRLAPQLDHAAVLQPWADAFGSENIILRCDERGQLDGSTVQDFSRVIGLDPISPAGPPEDKPRHDLGRTHIEFLHLCNIHLKNNPDIHRFLIEQFLRSRLPRQPQGVQLLSEKKQREILEQFENSNRDVARRYLHRVDGSLFYDPWPDPDEAREHFTGLGVEEVIPIFIELIYEQARWEQTGQPVRTFLRITNTLGKKVTGRNGSPASCSSAAADFPPHELGETCTVDELVPRVAESLYRRSLSLPEDQPLATALAMVNRLLARALSRVPLILQQRIYRRLYRGFAGGGLFDD